MVSVRRLGFGLLGELETERCDWSSPPHLFERNGMERGKRAVTNRSSLSPQETFNPAFVFRSGEMRAHEREKTRVSTVSSNHLRTVAARIEVAMIEENILRLREVCEIDGED